MAVPKSTRWPIEPHTRTKHLILRRYLEAWLPIMATHHGRILFVDGFAGPGRYSGGEEGSPLIALRALLDHPHFRRPQTGREVLFLFIEKQGDRAAALKDEIGKLRSEREIPAWVKVRIENKEFAEVMNEILGYVEAKGTRLIPCFAFLDPFGFSGVPMETIRRLVQNERCECLITFMYESINRFLSHPESKIQAKYDELFGTGAWREIAQEKDPELRRDTIVSLYRSHLIEQAGFEYVRTFEMINQGNRTEYFLFFGTNHPLGLSKMKQAMWKADPEGGQTFSDRTELTPQMILFERNPDLNDLRKRLRQRFRGSGWAAIKQIEEFVRIDTPYSEALHLRRATLAPMEQEDPPLIQVQRPPEKRQRPGEYPPGTKIKFL